MTSGVYQIICRETGHRYIGSSRRIEKRWGRHTECLNKGTHHNGWLQRAWAKYGRDMFSFEIIEECGENRVEREQYHMDLAGNKLKNASKTAHCADTTPRKRRVSSATALRLIAEGRFGYQSMNEEARARQAASMSRLHKGRKNTEKSLAKMRASQRAHWSCPTKKAAHKKACEKHALVYWTPERRAKQAERAREQMNKRWHT